MASPQERQQRPTQPEGPDGSLSWIVAVACSWNLLWSSLVRRSTGVIYVALVRTFGTSREQTSWVLSVGTSLAWLIGPLVGLGTRHMPLMALSFLGCFVTAVSAIGCAFAQDMTTVFFLLGICSAIGNGIGMPTNDVIIGKYFRRYRGSASGIYYAGGTVAAFAFPPIMNLLLKEYGFLGTFLITGGLMLNALATCPFYREPPWETKKEPKAARKQGSSVAEITPGANGDLRRESAASLHKPEEVATVEGIYKAITQVDNRSVGAEQRNDSNHVDKRYEPCLNGASISQNSVDFASYANGSSRDRHQAKDVVVKSTDDSSGGDRASNGTVTETSVFPPTSPHKQSSLFSFSFLNRKQKSVTRDEPPCSRQDDAHTQNGAANISGSVNVFPPLKSAGSQEVEIAPDEILDAVAVEGDKESRHQMCVPETVADRGSHWAYLKSPVFYMIGVTCAVSVYNYLVLMILVDLAIEKGFTRHDGAMLLSVSAIGDACARVGAGVLSDRPFCDRRVLMGTSAMLAGGVCVALAHVHVEFYWLAVVLCALFGWSNGTTVVLFGPVLADQVGVESLGLSSGTCRFVMGVSFLACPKITGYFKDKVGSYNGLLYLVSIGCFFVSAMWTVDFIYRLIKRRRARNAC